MQTSLRISDNVSNRKKDENGFLIIKNNPIAKAGVFDYYLKEILPNDTSDEIVKVCRTFDNLEKNKDLFAQKPIVYNHKWVGDEEMKADGAIGSEITAHDPYLFADLIIYNPDLIEKIENDEIVEISPGYQAVAKKVNGSYKGQDYHYLQELENVNHIAIVANGRSGSDLRIKDKGIQTMKSKFLDKVLRRFRDDSVDKREIIKQILAIAEKPDDSFEGGEDEKFDEVLGLLEKLGYNESEDKEKVTDDEEVKKDDDKDDKDDKKVEDDGDDDKKSDVEDDGMDKEDIINLIKQVVAEEVKKSVSKVQDNALMESKKIADAYNRVSTAIGYNFNNAGMSESEIYAYGYESISKNKLDRTMDSKTAFNIVATPKIVKTTDEKSDNNKVLELLKKVNRS